MTRIAAAFAACLIIPATLSAQEGQEAAIQAVRQSGGQVLELAQNDPRLDVAFHLSNVELTPDHLKPLDAIKDRLVHLNLRGTNLDDDLAQHLKPLAEVTRLHLEKTAVTDAGLPNVSGLTKLEYLNLYGTAVTDAGLEHLAGLKNLKKLYVWETKVTLDGVRKLRTSLPELEIIGGPEEPKPATPKEPVVAPKPPSPPAQ